jgi:hypothetical protein
LGSCAIEVDYGSDVFQNHHEKNDTPGQNDQVHHTHNISNQNHPHQTDHDHRHHHHHYLPLHSHF